MIKEPDIVLGEIIDNYKIVEVGVARGKFGVIHKAKRGGEAVALKFLLGDPSSSEYQNQAKLFKREYQRLTELSHPHISKALGFGFYKGFLYLASEFIENAAAFYNGTRGLLAKDMIPLFIQILEGLDYIHRNGFVHLDIKSENILLTKTAGKQIAKIIDFGIITSIEEMNQGGLKGGTFPYVAPEVALDEMRDKIDGRADLFSFAVLMYYSISNRIPYERSRAHGDFNQLADIIKSEKLPKPPSEYSPRSLPYLDTIITRLLAKNPDERFYPNARAVINALLTNQPDAFGAPEITASYLRPIGDKHIGRKTEQVLLNEAFEELISGHQPEHAIFCIRGGVGLGKSHFLKSIRRKAELNPEKIDSAYVQMPANNIVLEKIFSKLNRQLTENNLPTIILIDDLHELADTNIQHIIIGFLNYAKDKLLQPNVYTGTKPVVICFTYDLDQDLSSYDNEKTVHIELKPFSREDIEAYLKTTPVFKEKEILNEWKNELYSKTLGIPGLLVACLEELDADGFLFDPAGNLHVAHIAGFKEKHPPPLIRDDLLKKYNSLSIIEKETINLIAVWNFKGLAKPIRYSDIANFFYSASLGQAINTLIGKGVIQYVLGGEVEKAISFANEYFNHVVYENMRQEEKEIIHDSLASYFKRGKDIIALHISYGSDKIKALESINELGQYKLYKEGNATLAIELLGYGLKIASNNVWKLNLAILLIEAYYHSGKYKDSEGLYDESWKYINDLAPIDRKHWRIELAIKLIPPLIEQQLFDKADKVADEALALCVDETIIPQTLILKNFKAAILYKKSQFDLEKSEISLQKAREIYEKNEQIENTLSSADRNKIRNNELGIVLRLLGNHVLAVSKLKKKLNKVEAVSNVFDIFLITFSLAESCRLAGFYDDAIKHCKKTFALAALSGKGNWLMLAHDLIANVYYDMGRFDEAIEESNKCISLCACLGPGYEVNCFYSLLRIGHCFKERMLFKKAEIYFETVINKAKQLLSLMYAHLGLGEVYYHNEKYSESLKHIMVAEKFLMNLPSSISAPYTYRINELKTDIAKKQKDLKDKKPSN
ncbi:MAG: serine/threonine protein kinase [Deltaproteobacteria bacterium]|nr:serine/threonine protein kinase [Deltaproteobacteria bacterium]